MKFSFQRIRFTSLTIFATLFLNQAFSQELILNNTLFIGGGDSCYVGCRNAITASDGGIVFVGITSCSGKNDIPNGFGSSDLVVGKISSINHTIQWIKLFGGAESDQAYAIKQTPDGGFYIVGQTSSNTNDIPFNRGSSDVWIMRLDKDGKKLWSKTYGSSSSESAESFAITSDSGLIILGSSNGFGDDVPSHHTTSQFVYDWFVIKLDKNGDKQWTKSLGGDGDEYLFGSIMPTNNGYILAASSNSTNYDCTDNSWHPNLDTKYDYYLLKLDTAGNLIWNKSYGGSADDYLMNAILSPTDSSMILYGYSKSTDYLAANNHGQVDILVIKVDKDGKVIWSNCYGGTKDDRLGRISQLSESRFSIYNTTTSSNLGGEDTELFIIDSLGKIITQKVIGDTSPDHAAMSLPINDKIIVMGTTGSDSFIGGINTAKKGLGDNIFITSLYFFNTTISKAENEKEVLTIYPNPAKEKLTIELGKKEAGHLVLYDNSGRKLFEKRYSKVRAIDLSVTDFPSGSYLFFWKNEEGKISTGRAVIN